MGTKMLVSILASACNWNWRLRVAFGASVKLPPVEVTVSNGLPEVSVTCEEANVAWPLLVISTVTVMSPSGNRLLADGLMFMTTRGALTVSEAL